MYMDAKSQQLVLLFTLSSYFAGGVRLCGGIGTVLGPGFGALGFFLGVGDGVDLL